MFLLIPVLILGCSARAENYQLPDSSGSNSLPSESNVKDDANYIPSAIRSDFPVPKEAQKTNHPSKNPDLKYVRYAYQGLMDSKKRERYFAEIEKWGWNEEKQEQMGSMHVFSNQKTKERVHITIHDNFFTIFFRK